MCVCDGQEVKNPSLCPVQCVMHWDACDRRHAVTLDDLLTVGMLLYAGRFRCSIKSQPPGFSLTVFVVDMRTVNLKCAATTHQTTTPCHRPDGYHGWHGFHVVRRRTEDGGMPG